MLSEKEKANFLTKFPILEKITDLQPVTWLNPNKRNIASANLSLQLQDMKEAEARWQRFIPFFRLAFAEMKNTDGIIESPLRSIAQMKHALENKFSKEIEGNLYLKCDHELPIAGSIKARGGFYEVLHHAENLLQEAGLLNSPADYEKLAKGEYRSFFQSYSIGVGSTGNLGLSIGILSAKLGFNVSVYMSQDAKRWKKDLLREKGAIVHEFDGDFSEAIAAGRKETKANPNGYFVDDENSKHLFLGYSTAAFRLKKQLEEQGVQVSEEHPLFLYLPCGVGGAPGGITFGMKQIFGDAVHCFFVEPTHSPAVLIGLLTGEKEKVSVQDFGIDNLTEADGLAVGRPSSFASSFSEQLISGIYTIEDRLLFQLLALLADAEQTFVEPSATAGLIGPLKIQQTNYMEKNNINPKNVTHIVWSTGGSLVPERERKAFYEKGKNGDRAKTTR